MNDDDIYQKLGKISQILQDIKDALIRRGVIKKTKSDIFRDAATNYASENAGHPLTLGPNGHITDQEEYSTYHDGIMDEMPSPSVVNTGSEKAKGELKTPEPEYPISDKL